MKGGRLVCEYKGKLGREGLLSSFSWKDGEESSELTDIGWFGVEGGGEDIEEKDDDDDDDEKRSWYKWFTCSVNIF